MILRPSRTERLRSYSIAAHSSNVVNYALSTDGKRGNRLVRPRAARRERRQGVGSMRQPHKFIRRKPSRAPYANEVEKRLSH